MATKEHAIAITREANADLSALQFTFVDLDANGQVGVPTGAGAMAIGVLQDKPAAAGRAAEVDVIGVTKVIAGAATAAGLDIQTTAAGLGIEALTGDVIIGYSLTEALASGDLMEVLLISKHHIP